MTWPAGSSPSGLFPPPPCSSLRTLEEELSPERRIPYPGKSQTRDLHWLACHHWKERPCLPQGWRGKAPEPS